MKKSKIQIAKDFLTKYPGLDREALLKKGMPKKVNAKDLWNAKNKSNTKKSSNSNTEKLIEFLKENPEITYGTAKQKFPSLRSGKFHYYRKRYTKGEKPLKNKGLMHKIMALPMEGMVEKDKQLIIDTIKKMGEALRTKIDVIEASNYNEIWVVQFK